MSLPPPCLPLAQAKRGEGSKAKAKRRIDEGNVDIFAKFSLRLLLGLPFFPGFSSVFTRRKVRRNREERLRLVELVSLDDLQTPDEPVASHFFVIEPSKKQKTIACFKPRTLSKHKL